jgi:hypothetical protein
VESTLESLREDRVAESTDAEWRARSSGGDVEGVGEEDLEEHRVVVESTELAWREEEEVHHTVEDLLESLREDRVCPWLMTKNKGIKAPASLQIPAIRFDGVIRGGGCPPWLGARLPGKLGQ